MMIRKWISFVVAGIRAVARSRSTTGGVSAPAARRSRSGCDRRGRSAERGGAALEQRGERPLTPAAPDLPGEPPPGRRGADPRLDPVLADEAAAEEQRDHEEQRCGV